MNIEDRQLDEWLRDVDVPSDLNERLLAMPNTATVVERSPKHRLTIAAAILAVAASIIGVVVVVRWSNSTTLPTFVAKNSADLPSAAEIKGPQNSAVAKAVADPLEDVRANIDFIDIMIRERTIRDLSDKLAAMSDSSTTMSLGASQRSSLIVCMSDQSALQLGAARQWVEKDMARVIERFPNTSGAKLAEQFISQKSIQ